MVLYFMGNMKMYCRTPFTFEDWVKKCKDKKEIDRLYDLAGRIDWSPLDDMNK